MAVIFAIVSDSSINVNDKKGELKQNVNNQQEGSVKSKKKKEKKSKKKKEKKQKVKKEKKAEEGNGSSESSQVIVFCSCMKRMTKICS